MQDRVTEADVHSTEPPVPPRKGDWYLGLREWKLLIAAILLILVYVFRHTGSIFGSSVDIVDELLIAAVLFLSLSVAGVSRRTWMLNIAVAIAAVAASIVGTVGQATWGTTGGDAIGGYMLVVTIVVQMSITLRSQRVTGDTLFGAMAIYLSIGILFGVVYTAAATHNPAAFDPVQTVVGGQTKLYYFSFVTLTSLGYGDINPAGEWVQILATLESVLGAILLVALMGRIVGLLVAQQTNTARD